MGISAKKILCTGLFLLLIQPYGFGVENVKQVYLNEAIQAALKNNLDLESAKINIIIAKNNIKSANRLQNPEFNAYYFLGAAGRSEPRQLGFSQNIEIAKRSARKKLAESTLDLVKKNVDYTTFDLKMDVREAYINLVAQKSILETLIQQQGLQEELLKIAQNKVKQNNAPEIEAIQAEIALNQMITQVNTARVNVRSALSDFNKVINDPNDLVYDSKDKLFAEENNFEEMLTPPPDYEFPPFSEIVESATKNRYDIQIAKQEIDVAEKKLAVITRQRIPDLELVGGYAYKPAAYADNGNFNNGAYAGANLVNIPLFYNYSPEIQNAALELKQTELKYASIKNKAIKDVSTAYGRFLTAVENLNYYESKIVTGSEELIKTSKKSYEAGKADITSLIVMKQSYKSIIIGYTQALAEYYNSWTNFLREVNDENYNLPEDI